MREKSNLWRLYNSASAYGKRPSDFFPDLETDIVKWQLDEACLVVGRHVENNLNQNKPAFEGLDTTLTPALSQSGRGGYRSAKNRPIKKVKMKPDGTW